MSDNPPEQVTQMRAKRQFKKFNYRGIELEKLVTLTNNEFQDIVHARVRRRLKRKSLKTKHKILARKLKASKMAAFKAAQDVGPETKIAPEPVKTHLRDMVITPDLIGCRAGVYNGKKWADVEIKGEMVGMYLGEFSMSYTPVKHGRPGMGSTASSRFIPLK